MLMRPMRSCSLNQFTRSQSIRLPQAASAAHSSSSNSRRQPQMCCRSPTGSRCSTSARRQSNSSSSSSSRHKHNLVGLAKPCGSLCSSSPPVRSKQDRPLGLQLNYSSSSSSSSMYCCSPWRGQRRWWPRSSKRWTKVNGWRTLTAAETMQELQAAVMQCCLCVGRAMPAPRRLLCTPWSL